MGTACCPKRIDIPDKKETPNDVVNEILKTKLTPKQIMYDYVYENIKICLIRSEQIEAFFKNRKLFKLPQYEESNYYYNNFSMNNFLGKRNIILLLLQQLNDLSKKDAHIYHVEEICYLETSNNSAFQVISDDLKLKSMKNFLFCGIVNNSRKLNKIFKLIYKKNTNLGLEVNYNIHLHKNKIDEDAIKYILGQEENKYKLLKGIAMDKTQNQRVYYMIFEEDQRRHKEYEYIILTIEKDMENEYLLIEIAKKLNNFESHNYRLSCILSEKLVNYLILYREKPEETAD
jgi:hypothetical protein